MKNKRDIHLDRFIDKIVKESSLEQPSNDFTQHIIAQVQPIERSQNALTYKPLISGRTWLVLALTAIGLLTYVIFWGPSEEPGWSKNIRLELPGSIDLSFNQTVLRALSSAVSLFTLFLMFDVFLIRSLINKRYKL